MTPVATAGLGVGVQQKDGSRLRQRPGQVGGKRRVANASLLIHDRDDGYGAPSRGLGHWSLGNFIKMLLIHGLESAVLAWVVFYLLMAIGAAFGVSMDYKAEMIVQPGHRPRNTRIIPKIFADERRSPVHRGRVRPTDRSLRRRSCASGITRFTSFQ